MINFLPFHRSSSNVVCASILSASTVIGFVSTINIVTNKPSILLIVLFVLVLPSSTVGFLASYFRARKMYRLAKNIEQQIVFHKEFEVEIATRFVYYKIKENKEDDQDILETVC